MQLIRAGKVVWTDETTTIDPDTLPPEVTLTAAELSRMASHAAYEARQALERTQIIETVATMASFKHTEPKSIFSPAGRVLNQFVAPTYKQPRHRQGHWAPYERAL